MDRPLTKICKKVKFSPIIIIIIIFVITFMKYICNYIPETDRVSTVHSVTAVMYLQFVLHVMLFRTFTLAFSEVCTQC